MGKTSPAKSTRRGAGKPGRSSPPCWVSRARIDGAEYQTLILRAARKLPRRTGSLASDSPIRTRVAAFRQETKRSKIDRSKWNGAWEEKRSRSVPRTERLLAPVQEREGIGMREHDSLGLAGRARGEQDVGQVVLVEAGGQGGRGIVGHDLGPERSRRGSPAGWLRAERAPRLSPARRAPARRGSAGAGSQAPPMPRARPAASGPAITTALTPLAAKMPAARTAGPEGSTGT